VTRVLAPELEQKKPRPEGKRTEGMPDGPSAADGARKRKSTGEPGDENDPAASRRVARKLDFGA